MPFPTLKATIVLPAFARSLPADGNRFNLNLSSTDTMQSQQIGNEHQLKKAASITEAAFIIYIEFLLNYCWLGF
jgi:hypothetical protein